jgi:hypothetical protein
VLSEVLRLILCNEIVQSSQHVRLVSVEIALNSTCQDALSEVHYVGEVDVQC